MNFQNIVFDLVRISLLYSESHWYSAIIVFERLLNMFVYDRVNEPIALYRVKKHSLVYLLNPYELSA